MVGAVLEAIACSFVLFEANAHPNGILFWVGLFCMGAGVLFSVGVVCGGRAAYLNTILFRLAVGQPIPDIDQAHLSGEYCTFE